MADYDTLSVSDKVGIGTETPLTQLHIASSTSTPSQAFLESGGALLKITVDSSGASIGTDNAFSLSILTDNSSRLSITDDGKVGIGTTTTPTERLEVDGNVKANSFFGNGADLDGIVKKAGDNTMTGALTIDNNLTVNGAIATAQLSVSDQVTGSLIIENDLTVGNAIATKEVNATGKIQANRFEGDGSGLDGIVKKSGDTMTGALTVNGAIATNQLSVTDKVGIGTKDPGSYKLNVQGNQYISGDLTVNGKIASWLTVGDPTQGNAINLEMHNQFHRIAFHQLRFWDWGVKEDMVTFHNGNVGIGIQNPQAKLEVAGALKLSKAGTLLFHNTNESGNPNGDGFRIRYDNNFFQTGADVLVVEKTDGNQANPDGGIAFVNTGNDGVVETALVIKGNGNVGVGTTSPSNFKLNIGGTGGQNGLHIASDFGLRSNNRLNLIRFGSDGDYQILHKASGAFGRNTLAMHVHADDAFGVYSSGWNPLFEIQGGTGDVYTKGNIMFAGSIGGFTGDNKDEWPKITWYRDVANNWDEGLIKHSSSRGFFGRAGYGIHIHHSRDWGIWSSGWRALLGVEGGTGNLKIRGTLQQGSSRELKENINNLATEEAMETLEGLNPIKFNYKEDDQKETHLGFIAEDVPELVASQDRKGLSPMDIVAVLTKVVKEQQNMISGLTKKVKTLEQKNR